MLQAKYTAETRHFRLDGLEKALATLEKERLLYMEKYVSSLFIQKHD
jgi:hypothetical protein